MCESWQWTFRLLTLISKFLYYVVQMTNIMWLLYSCEHEK